MRKLEQVGWNSFWEETFREMNTQDLVPGRVISSHGSHYEICTADGMCVGELAGKMRYETLYRAGLPVTGDWVGLSKNSGGPVLIKSLLPRQSSLERWEVKNDEAQVLAANVDFAFVFQSLDRELNMGGLDRLLAMIWEGGAIPRIILTKSDLFSAEEVDQKEVELKEAFPGVEVFVTSPLLGWGLEEVEESLSPEKTYAALGYSGAGKSTLLNYLLGEEKTKTQMVREDDRRGRHTTTSRSLFLLPGGAIYLDTPGIREIAVFSHDSMERAFRDIVELAGKCKFKDCSHNEEPGCEVKKALKEGRLDYRRWKSWIKLQQEQKLEEHKKRKLQKKISKNRIRRKKIHYKDFVRGKYDPPGE